MDNIGRDEPGMVRDEKGNHLSHVGRRGDVKQGRALAHHLLDLRR